MQFINILKRKLGLSIKDPKEVLYPSIDNKNVSSVIGVAINNEEPFLVSRLGWFEAYSLGYYETHGHINGDLKKMMWNTPGIFPPTSEEFKKFHAEYIKSISEIDILGLMKCPYEASLVRRHASSVHLCELADLEPYLHNDPWSRFLIGKRVLVIHPFADSIKSQYSKNRNKLFNSGNILPEFELSAIAPPQTMCGNTCGFPSWSDSLCSLKHQINERTFDVAILGCGAYGLPLGAFVKGMGKVAIHMGGATQLLFGVLGKRWEDDLEHKSLINEHWMRPNDAEKPRNWEHAEGGCYW